MIRQAALLVPAIALAMGGCMSVPEQAGPTAPARIGKGISFAQYEHDTSQCRQLAESRAGNPAKAMQDSQAKTAALMLIGTVVGLATGLAVTGGSGAGAVAGAALGTGAAAGPALAGGAYAGAASYGIVQQRYDGEYYACMNARGHRTPGNSNYS